MQKGTLFKLQVSKWGLSPFIKSWGNLITSCFYLVKNSKVGNMDYKFKRPALTHFLSMCCYKSNKKHIIFHSTQKLWLKQTNWYAWVLIRGLMIVELICMLVQGLSLVLTCRLDCSWGICYINKHTRRTLQTCVWCTRCMTRL